MVFLGLLNTLRVELQTSEHELCFYDASRLSSTVYFYDIQHYTVILCQPGTVLRDAYTERAGVILWHGGEELCTLNNTLIQSHSTPQGSDIHVHLWCCVNLISDVNKLRLVCV